MDQQLCAYFSSFANDRLRFNTYFAARTGNTYRINQLYTRHSEIEFFEYNNGQRLIHVACQFGHLDIVKIFSSFGFDLNVLDEKFNTPLHYSVKYGFEDVTSYLLSQSVFVNKANVYGQTPLHFANSCEIMDSLICAGADIDAIDVIGRNVVWGKPASIMSMMHIVMIKRSYIGCSTNQQLPLDIRDAITDLTFDRMNLLKELHAEAFFMKYLYPINNLHLYQLMTIS